MHTHTHVYIAISSSVAVIVIVSSALGILFSHSVLNFHSEYLMLVFLPLENLHVSLTGASAAAEFASETNLNHKTHYAVLNPPLFPKRVMLQLFYSAIKIHRFKPESNGCLFLIVILFLFRYVNETLSRHISFATV